MKLTRMELESAMGSLFGTFMTDPRKLTKIAELAEEDPVLFISEIEERLEARERTRQNQVSGTLVEKLLKEALEKANKELGGDKFKVRRTGVGSDFAIENDVVEEGEQMIFEIEEDDNVISYLEVKSTVTDYVRMTITQAHHAAEDTNRHSLAVVPKGALTPTEDSVRDSVRFVPDIGNQVMPKVTEADNLKLEEDIAGVPGDIQLEFDEGPMHIRIKKPVWQNRFTFQEFVQFLLGK